MRVEYLNRDDVLLKIRMAVENLKMDPNIVSVRIFGSLVRGDYVPGSDADILIVLKEDSRRIIDRIPEYLDFFRDVPMPVEVFPYTEEEIGRMKTSGNLFLQEILNTGVEL